MSFRVLEFLQQQKNPHIPQTFSKSSMRKMLNCAPYLLDHSSQFLDVPKTFVNLYPISQTTASSFWMYQKHFLTCVHKGSRCKGMPLDIIIHLIVFGCTRKHFSTCDLSNAIPSPHGPQERVCLGTSCLSFIVLCFVFTIFNLSLCF